VTLAEGSAKIGLLVQLLRGAIADGHRSLVFSQWPSYLDLVGARLDELGLAHLRLDGRTRQRGRVLERWREPGGPPVFLISTKAGGLGLNLTEADHVFHLDPWWNPASEDQASDRAHRIGQTRPVFVHKLVAADTVEEKILELQARKRRIFRAAVDHERLAVDELSREDLEAVFAPDAYRGEGDLPRAELLPLPVSPKLVAKDADTPCAADGEGVVVKLFDD
jgi:SNF2 family DNA or RNA helicase